MKSLYQKISLAGAVLFLAAVSVAIIINGRPGDLFVDDTRYSKEIAEAAARHGIPAQLVRAVVFQESRFDPTARGKKGEYGLMQLLPSGAVADWAKYRKQHVPSAEELLKPELNLEIGCWYLGRALRRWRGYDGAVELALAQYNAGEGRAKRWKPESKKGQVTPRITIASTKRYVEQICRRYRNYIK